MLAFRKLKHAYVMTKILSIQLISKVSLFHLYYKHSQTFLISNFRRVLNVVCFLLGNSPASEFYISTFRNIISSIFIGRQVCVHSTHTYLPMKFEQIECSEKSAYKIQTPGIYPEESIQQLNMYVQIARKFHVGIENRRLQ